MTVDLTRSGSFASHGLAGTVKSTLAIDLGRRAGERSRVANPPRE
jgi:hypothetical protein